MIARVRWLLGDLAYTVRWHLRSLHLWPGENLSYCGADHDCGHPDGVCLRD